MVKHLPLTVFFLLLRHLQLQSAHSRLRRMQAQILVISDARLPLNVNRWFCQWLDESSTDFRVGAEPLSSLSFAVFGCGNSLYTDHFNTVLLLHIIFSIIC